MKTAIGVLLVLGMVVFQSNWFNGTGKLVASILGVCCLIGIVIWLYLTNKKKGIVEAVFQNDLD